MNQTNLNTTYRHDKPFVFTIFGASGDLAKLKIFPAFFALAEQHRFLKKYTLIGYARSSMTTKKFRGIFIDSVKSAFAANWTEQRQRVLDELIERVFYFSGQYDQADDFLKYQNFRDQYAEKYTQEIFYFSTPPQVFVPIVENLATFKSKEKIQLILEKPFGNDQKSAEKLFHRITECFEPDQIFLLDHYLGKKAVRSILPLRYNNPLLNLALQGKHIRTVQISALEPFGVENRLGYFDQTGTLKDMIQSHLLQILGLTIMTIPLKKSAENIHREKNNILEALKFEEKNSVALGQYEGYCQQQPDLCSPFTNTFAAIKLTLDRENWAKVPILLRSGKFIGNEKKTYITVELEPSTHHVETIQTNKIIIELSPEESIRIRLVNENGDKLEEIGSHESIACHGDFCLPEHGVLFLDVFRGNFEHFLSIDEILSCWRLVDQITKTIHNQKPEPYAQHSDGPSNQKQLIAGTDLLWYEL